MNAVLQKTAEDKSTLACEQKKKSTLTALFNSNLAWLLIALLATEAVVYFARPLKMVQVEGTVLKDHDHTGNRITKILQNQNQKNAIIVGDSTADGLCFYADLKTQNLKLDTISHYQYLDAKTADSVLQKTLNSPIFLQNITFGGCLMQDQSLMCHKYLETGKTPKIAFLTVVPRPFFDTTVDERISPVKCYFENRYNSIADAKNFSQLFDYFLSKVSNIYRTRSDYATVLCSLACSNLDRPLNAYENRQEKGLGRRNKVSLARSKEIIDPNISNDSEATKREVVHYTDAYQFSQELFDRQFKEFETMVSELTDKGAVVIILKLPLEQINLSLIEPEKLNMLNDRIQQCSSKHNSSIIDFQDSPDFNKIDFKDGVHLNGQGAIKFWNKLASQIDQNPVLKERLLNRLQ